MLVLIEVFKLVPNHTFITLTLREKTQSTSDVYTQQPGEIPNI